MQLGPIVFSILFAVIVGKLFNLSHWCLDQLKSIR